MTRKIQPISFNMENIYEKKLHEYALKQDKYFSQYVKRLIDKDRSGKSVNPVAQVESVKKVAEERKPVKFNKSAVKRFL